MEKVYRKIGYITCFAILIVLLLISIFMGKDLSKGPNTLLVKFSNVGTLIPHDPVLMAGVTIGRVSGIRYVPGTALVTLELYKRLKIPKDSRIINFNHSLMGERLIQFERGASKIPMDFSLIQEGHFEPGIAEMLHEADKIVDMVKRYNSVALQLKNGNDSTASMITIYHNEILPFLAKFSGFLEELTVIEGMVTDKADMLVFYMEQLSVLTNKAHNQVPKLLSQSQNAVMGLARAADTIAVSVEALNRQLDEVNRKGTLANDLVYEREIFEMLKKLNISLNTFVQILKAEGLADIINFWRNVHLMGRNPTKKGQDKL